MNRINTLSNHFLLSRQDKTNSNNNKICLPSPVSVLGRTSTALEPSLLDEARRSMVCHSILEREAWLKYFISVRPKIEEGDYECTEIEGVLPEYLKGGSFFRSGPGLFEKNGIRIHMADGDGLIVRIDFRLDGKLFMKKQYLQTPEYLKELNEDRIIYRGSYGTSQVQAPTFLEKLRKNIGNLDWKITGNTNHLYWGGRLFALHEVGSPIELNPQSLEVVDNKSTLNGILEPNEPFSAHHRFDREKRTLLNFGIDYRNRKGPICKFWEFDENFKLFSQSTFQLPINTVVHSFAATEHYFIQLFAPTKGGIGYLFGWGVDDSIYHNVEAEHAYICIVDRNQLNKNNATYYKCVNWWPNHHVGAYETASGDIILDSVMYERKTVGWIEREPFDLPKTRVVRFKIPHGKNIQIKNELLTTSLRVTHEVLYNHDCEMPIVNPNTELKPHQFIYLVDMTASKMKNSQADGLGLSHRFGEALLDMPWTGIVKLDLIKHSVQSYHPECFCGEVVFVPDPNGKRAEDDGVLLSLIFDPTTMQSSLIVMDAKDIAKGPIAKVKLPGHIPFSFHCGWEPAYPF